MDAPKAVWVKRRRPVRNRIKSGVGSGAGHSVVVGKSVTEVGSTGISIGRASASAVSDNVVPIYNPFSLDFAIAFGAGAVANPFSLQFSSAFGVG